MIEIKLSWNLQDLENHYGSLTAQAIKNVDQALLDSGYIVQGYAIKRIQTGGRSGKVYKVNGKYGQRSAPGEYPKTDTGRLASSIRVNHPQPLTVVVGSDVSYSESLENGTAIMAARPWLQRSFDENYDIIGKLIQESIERSI